MSKHDSEQSLFQAIRTALRVLIRLGSTSASDLILKGGESVSLARAAGIARTDTAAAEAIVDRLHEAIATLGPAEERAAIVLFGIDPSAQGKPLASRREMAAKWARVRPTTFRIHHEPTLVESLAEEIQRRLEVTPLPVGLSYGAGFADSAQSDEADLWCQWSPLNAGAAVYENIARAVEEFRAIETPAGAAAEEWLKTKSLDEHPRVVTYLLFGGAIIKGFFAIESGSVMLGQRDRKSLSGGDGPPRVGASMLTWIARHDEAEPGIGRSLLLYAVSIALQVARLQGNVVFVLHPYDEAEADVYRSHYGFRWDRERQSLWIPLHPAQTGQPPAQLTIR